MYELILEYAVFKWGQLMRITLRHKVAATNNRFVVKNPDNLLAN